jgi:chromate reductase
LGALSANVIEGSTLLIPFIRSKIDAGENVTDEGTIKGLASAFNAFIKAID